MRIKSLPKPLALMTAAIIGLYSTPSLSSNIEDIYKLALDNDHQLKADEAAYQASKENLTIGRSALLPQINASAGYSKSDEEQINDGQEVFSNVKSDNNYYGLTLTQPLFNMAAWFGYKQGAALSKQGEAQFSADQQAFIIRVAEAYLNVLRSIDNLTTAQAEEKALSHQLEQTRQRFEVGLTAITDVHEAQSAFDNSTAATFVARGNVGIAFEELEVLTGTTHSEVAPLKDSYPVADPTPKDRSAWVEFALENNNSLKTAKLATESARQFAKAATSGHMPTVGASINYQKRNDTNFDDGGGLRFDDANTIGVTLNVPVFSGLNTSGKRRQAHAQFMQAQEQYNQTQRSVIQGARSFHLSVVTGVAQVKARRQAVISSTSALEASQAGYEVGTRNLVDVLVTQQNLYNSQRNLDNAIYDYMLNMLRLKQTAGNLSPEDIIGLNQWLDSEKKVDRSIAE